MERITIGSLATKITSEADAYAFMEALRWPEQPVCPHCGSINDHYFLTPKAPEGRKTRTGSVSERRVWKCKDCRKQFSVLTGTIFHGSKVPLRTWLFVVFEMAANKNGLAAREIERKYGVSPKTAWFMAHRIREAMKTRAPLALLTGTIVADETFIGGNPQRMNAATRRRYEAPVKVTPGSLPRLGTRKTPVLSLINAETGEARSKVVADVSGHTLRTVIADNVAMGSSRLMTDEGAQYHQLGREFVSHETVNHSEDEYVRGDVSTNLAEGYFSQLKRSLDGTHHHVSREHLDRYLAEFDFRYSSRKLTDTQRTARLMGQTTGRRLTYKRLAGS
jgi:transposase-like protein